MWGPDFQCAVTPRRRRSWLPKETKSPVHTGEMSRSLVRQGEQDSDEKCANAQLASPDARRETIFQIGADKQASSMIRSMRSRTSFT